MIPESIPRSRATPERQRNPHQVVGRLPRERRAQIDAARRASATARGSGRRRARRRTPRTQRPRPTACGAAASVRYLTAARRRARPCRAAVRCRPDAPGCMVVSRAQPAVPRSSAGGSMRRFHILTSPRSSSAAAPAMARAQMPPAAPQTFTLSGNGVRGYQNIAAQPARSRREDARGRLRVQADARRAAVRPARGARRAQPVRHVRRAEGRHGRHRTKRTRKRPRAPRPSSSRSSRNRPPTAIRC